MTEDARGGGVPSGRSDFLGLSIAPALGAAPFPAVEAINRLDRALESEAGLSGLGTIGARVDLQWQLDTLVRGLATVERRTPMVGLVIAGLPRTGTTALHHLLVSTGQHRSLSVLQALRPTAWVPSADPDHTAEQRVVQDYAATRVASIRLLAPELMRMHPVSEAGPEECTPILQSSLLCLQMSIMYRVPTFSDWVLGQDLAGAYRFWNQQVQSLTPAAEDDDRPWLLKSPLHFPQYRTLLQATECGVVQIRRDVVSWFHSFLNLVLLARSIFAHPDPIELGREWLKRLPPLCLDAAEAVADHPQRFLTISYRQLRRDPVAVCGSLLQWDLSGVRATSVDRAEVTRAAEAISRAHGKGPWPLEHFGVRPEEIVRMFGPSIRAGFFDDDQP